LGPLLIAGGQPPLDRLAEGRPGLVRRVVVRCHFVGLDIKRCDPRRWNHRSGESRSQTTSWSGFGEPTPTETGLAQRPVGWIPYRADPRFECHEAIGTYCWRSWKGGTSTLTALEPAFIRFTSNKPAILDQETERALRKSLATSRRASTASRSSQERNAVTVGSSSRLSWISR
jgi:hypothetical protein